LERRERENAVVESECGGRERARAAGDSECGGRERVRRQRERVRRERASAGRLLLAALAWPIY
jgi:hypothetical protein